MDQTLKDISNSMKWMNPFILGERAEKSNGK